MPVKFTIGAIGRKWNTFIIGWREYGLAVSILETDVLQYNKLATVVVIVLLEIIIEFNRFDDIGIHLCDMA
jgi:hypothetical protein